MGRFIATAFAAASVFLYSFQALAGSLWFADHKNLYQVDTSTNQIARSLKLDTFDQLAADPSGVWVLSNKQLQRFDTNGNSVVSLDLKPLMKDADQIAVDGVDNSVWISGKKEIRHLAASGQSLGSYTTAEHEVIAIAVGLDQTLWLLDKKLLSHYSAQGALLASIDVHAMVKPEPKPKLLALDAIGHTMWLAGDDNLIRIDLLDPTNVKLALDTVKKVQAMALDPRSGTLWAVTDKALQAYSHDGVLIKNLDLKTLGIKDPNDLEFDVKEQSVWVGHKDGASRFSAAGDFILTIATDKKTEVIAVPPFTLGPTVTLISPLNGALTSNATPTFKVGYGAVCSGNPCGFANGYYSSYSLVATLGSQSIGPAFLFDGITGTASYTPASRIPEGSNSFTAQAKDSFGRLSNTITMSFTIDTIPPIILGLLPSSPFVTNRTPVHIVGHLSEAATLKIGSVAVPIAADNSFTFDQAVVEGANAVVLQATDLVGNTSSQTLSITLDTVRPASVVVGNVSFGTATPNVVVVTGVAGSVEGSAIVRITNMRTGQFVEVSAGTNGAFSAQIAGQAGDQFQIIVVDAAGNSSTPTTTTVPGGVAVIPPDPSTVAPPVDRTVVSIMAQTTAFLYTGANPIQTGVAPGTIEPKRAAVLRGKVQSRDDQALSGAKITVLNHPEFGQTLSRADGMFDMAVNGGGVLNLRYEKAGFLLVQRQINAPWQDFAFSPDVVMIPFDVRVTTINLNAATPIQAAQGGAVTDADGTRRATILFPQGVTASMVLSDGTNQPLPALNVRATEYTVGANGPKAMPGPLPPPSGYTYAVELSVDEAVAAGAREVRFSQPLPVYVENLLNFPVGGIVPAGYYDRDKAAWIPAPNGRVIKILAMVNGAAVLDTNGDGVADNATQLAVLNISDAERTQLATLYAAGQTLWRVPVSHFTSWDFNWPYGPPPDAIDPKQPEPTKDYEEDKCDVCDGSIVEAQNQTLGEQIGVTGAPFDLNYKSDRVQGRKVASTSNITLSGASVPASLNRIELVISIAGRQFTQIFPVAANQNASFTWDGQDAYGRPLQGSQLVNIRVGYVYGAMYQSPAQLSQSFGALSGIPLSGNRARQEITLWQESFAKLEQWDARTLGLGGWTASIHHSYDPNGKILVMGDGTRRSAQSISSVITTVAGNGTSGFSGDGGAATTSGLYYPNDVTIDPQGNLFIADGNNNRIRKVSSDGIITTVSGNGVFGFSGDGGIATAAGLNSPGGVVIDPQGNLFIADSGNHRIRKVSPDGIITTVAGNGIGGFSGDGGAATAASLFFPLGVAIDPQGNLFIADTNNVRIRKVSLDGTIATVAGNGTNGFSGDGGVATAAGLNSPGGVVIDRQGNLFIADSGNHRIRKVSPDGTITTVAGNGIGGFSGDGGAATAARLNFPNSVTTDPQGKLFIADTNNVRIRKVSLAGIITTVAGMGTQGFSGDGGAPTAASLYFPFGVTIDPQGTLFITDVGTNRVRKIALPLPGVDDFDLLIPSADGGELYHFNPTGRHLRTLNAKTLAVVYTFSYDVNGLLIQFTDGNGDITRIERDTAGNPTAIVTADNQRTMLTLDANGYLASVANPAGDTFRMTYTADGLLTAFTDPKASASLMTYDALGRLIRDQNAAGGFWSLSRTELAISPSAGYEASMTSAGGRNTTYRVENLATSDQRRTNFYADGTQSITLIQKNGATTTTAPDGTVTTSIEGPDPRFGMQAPIIQSLSIKTPSGLTAIAATTRSTDLNPTNPLSLLSEITTVAVNGRSFNSVYDAAARQFSGTSAEGRVSTTRTDSQGRPTFAQISGVEALNFGYDTRGRLQTITQGTGADIRSLAYTYGPDGFVQRITDATTQSTVYQRDAAGRVTQATRPDSSVVGFGFDANGNLASLTPPGKPVHGFAYTPVDLESQYTPPAAGLPNAKTQYAYNLDKQLTSVVRPDGTIVTAGYDGAGRLGTVTPSSGAGITVTYGYSATGQINSVGNANVTLGYTYDGALLKQETFAGTVTGSLTRTYDANFRTTGLALGASNVTLGYDRDSLLTSVGAMTLTRNAANGFLSGTTMGSVTTTQGYNAFGELANFGANYSATPLYTFALTYDKLGRIQTKTETIAGFSANFEYGYDLAGRLENVKQGGVLITTYGFNANGNRTHLNGALIGTYDDQDRIQTYAANTYTFGANGELRQKTQGTQTTGYSYDAFGNLKNVTLPDNTLIEYVLDGRNRRVGKKVNGTLIQGFLYQDQLRPIAELDGVDNVVVRFHHGTKVNVPEYMTKGSDTYRIVTDHLGSVRLVVNTTTSAIAQRLDYDEFGNVVLDTNPGFQPFGFAGGLYDKDTKLVRFGARDYDAETGRWTAKDPIRFDGGDTNLYAYVGGNPTSWIDPWGLVTVCSYPAGAHGLGHVGIGSNSSETRGFYPNPEKPGDPYSGQEGIVKVDSGPRDCKTITTTPEQDKKIDDFIANRTANPGAYSLKTGRVCTPFVRDALAAAGIRVPATSMSPFALFNSIPRQGLVGPRP